MDKPLGTAEWADPAQYAAENRFAPGKFWLGRSPVSGEPLGYADDRHICLVSGSRSGKGTTTIINNLCLWPGSLVVVDPKGENATVTAARRGAGSEHCKGLGQDVHVLDPFGAAQVDDSLRSCFNPLEELDAANPATIDEAGRLADAIVVVNPQSADPFWDQSARTMLKGLILHVLTAPQYEGRRTLVTVRSLVARGDHEGQKILREMGEAEVPSAQALLWEGVARNDAFNGVVAGIGESMVNMAVNAAKQFESVLQVANRNTEFLDSPGMQKCLARSDFKLAELKTNPRGVSVFLSLPQRYMAEHFRWLRMVTTLLLTELEAVKAPPATGHRVLVCLDEFAGLKRMEVVENAVSQIAGFGVKLFFVLQSLEQLRSVYKDTWETFLGNCGTRIFFGVSDAFTAEHVSSKLIGDTEVMRTTRSHSESTGESSSTTDGDSSSSSESRSTNEGTSWSEGENRGRTIGGARSSNSKAMPFFLRNTAEFFRALTGSRQTGASNNWGTSSGTSSTRGASSGVSEGHSRTEGQSHSKTEGTTRSENRGSSESVHKRPLITTDEIGRHFARVDDRDSPLYPGLALVLLSGQRPAPVRRVNYFSDQRFRGLYSPHPDHPTSSQWRELLVEAPPQDWLRYICRSVHDFNVRWHVDDGETIAKGQPYLTIKGLVPEKEVDDAFREAVYRTHCFPDPTDDEQSLTLHSPVGGVVRYHQETFRPSCEHFRSVSRNSHGSWELLELLVETQDKVDQSIIEASHDAIRRRCETARRMCIEGEKVLDGKARTLNRRVSTFLGLVAAAAFAIAGILVSASTSGIVVAIIAAAVGGLAVLALAVYLKAGAARSWVGIDRYRERADNCPL